MATRFYFSRTTAPPVEPSNWNFPNLADSTISYAMNTSKSVWALATRTDNTGTTSPIYKGMVRYVSSRQLNNTLISGNVNLALRCREGQAGANATLAMAVKVIASNGADRAILLGYTASDNLTATYEMGVGNLTSRRVWTENEERPIPLNNYTPTQGDYLVVEIGYRAQTTVTRAIVIQIGDNNSTGDLPDADNDENELCGWVEFSANIDWYTPPAVLAQIQGLLRRRRVL
jgi:hypothetical protein